MKKTVHIVSHTHWDREWYLPYENHHMRLIDLMDGVLEAFEDPDFKYYWLDGHYLPIEDYLQVRPQNKEKIKNLIEAGKLKLGPWYILQDAFLTSGESNLKNLSLGIKNIKKWGHPSMIGYFPDTFGNIGQASQILKKAGIDVAYFGRGVKATGFDNVVIEDFTSKNSEIYWQSPNGDKTLSVLFANWYANGLDIPEDEDELKAYMNKRIADMEKYASTNQLLLMNGCDHSPVQKNIGQIIKKANALYEDYNFIHSNLDLYFKALEEEVGDLDTIKGELRSQATDGWWTLNSTSSSRYYLKKYNKSLEMRFEEILQPLFTLFVDEDAYPQQKLDYFYQELVKNHPHDSICGCSIDSVHDGNLRRFKSVYDGLDYLEDFAKKKIRETTANSDDHAICIINTLPYKRMKEVLTDIEIDRKFFGIDYPEVYDELAGKAVPSLKLVDEDGVEIPAEITYLGTGFGYILPDDKFRKPYFANRARVRFTLKLKAFEKKILRLVSGKSSFTSREINEKTIENDFYKLEINDNASLNIYDKSSGLTFKNVLAIEDTGDIGNEYIYRQSTDGARILGGKLIDQKIIRENDQTIIKLRETFTLPKSAEDKLLAEQIRLNDITQRRANRASDLIEMTIDKEITLYDKNIPLKVKISLKNLAKDHRMRLLFGHNLATDKVYAESIFECVERDAYPPQTWKNPDYSQNFNRYVQVMDNDKKGFGVSAVGPAEYEMVRGEGLYITLFRSVGELGDWGYFPTPDAQLIKDDLSEMTFDFYFAGFENDFDKNRQDILQARVDFVSLGLDKNEIEKKDTNLPQIDLGDNLFSTLYRNDKNEQILRVYNPGESPKELDLKAVEYDILGNVKIKDEIDKILPGFEIKTYRLEL
ncbi:alpha-mannosidase [Anaerococcus sp. NML200574]|uniref:alpha-mannosidase n=1 Tax=Anaerococcus sp. NML200574 TaxID=2954486 RepID=UPI00223706E6|nr:glycoside hydrolase family 38 C-terminal domain-containing protein [Anaerococcus sp. NML200574]MCW6679117.1 alpha-mannosidase [Anaerococcus sp. NML200574]